MLKSVIPVIPAKAGIQSGLRSANTVPTDLAPRLRVDDCALKLNQCRYLQPEHDPQKYQPKKSAGVASASVCFRSLAMGSDQAPIFR